MEPIGKGRPLPSGRTSRLPQNRCTKGARTFREGVKLPRVDSPPRFSVQTGIAWKFSLAEIETKKIPQVELGCEPTCGDHQILYGSGMTLRSSSVDVIASHCHSFKERETKPANGSSSAKFYRASDQSRQRGEGSRAQTGSWITVRPIVT